MITPQAVNAIMNSDVICGYDKYVEQIKTLIPASAEIFTSGMKGEVERAEASVTFASSGRTVCLVCGGDPSLYALASLVIQLDKGRNDIEILPGITAAMAASARLGSPISDDLAIISMSDLLTPWDVIKNRIEAVNVGDFVAAIYNPKSMKRTGQLVYALNSFKESRGDLIMGCVKNAFRENEQIRISKISDFDYDFVDMTTIVMAGCRKTVMIDGKMVTPRGYPV